MIVYSSPYPRRSAPWLFEIDYYVREINTTISTTTTTNATTTTTAATTTTNDNNDHDNRSSPRSSPRWGGASFRK